MKTLTKALILTGCLGLSIAVNASVYNFLNDKKKCEYPYNVGIYNLNNTLIKEFDNVKGLEFGPQWNFTDKHGNRHSYLTAGKYHLSSTTSEVCK